MQTKLILIAASALASLACSSGDPVSIGENAPSKTGELLSDYAASWDGYVEAYLFPSGSDRVRLTLDANGDGYVEFGDVPPLPAPTDPDVGYPSNPTASGDEPEEGFRYTALDTRVEDSRIRLGTYNPELYQQWCEIQTPVPWLDNGTEETGLYGCLPNIGHRSIDGDCFLVKSGNDPIPVDCGKMSLCSDPFGPCHCEATGCGLEIPEAPPGSYHPVRLDGALEDAGNALVGTLVVGEERVTVRLERQ